jgi:adenosylcobinamide-phosphate synthase
MLDEESAAIGDLLLGGDLARARERAGSLVGRDTGTLDASDLSRAVIESLAENCVDAVTASMLWAAVGGAGAVAAHRAVNTLDAMVGHRSDRYRNYGWASARLDDAANYLPARLTAVAVMLARPRRGRQIWRVVHRDARLHPSPNGGVIEAAFAAALDLRLGGTNRYDGHAEHRGVLGDGEIPGPTDIARAIRLRRDTTLAFAAMLLSGSAARALARALIQRRSTRRASTSQRPADVWWRHGCTGSRCGVQPGGRTRPRGPCSGLRAAARAVPVHRAEVMDHTLYSLATRADVAAALRDHELWSNRAGPGIAISSDTSPGDMQHDDPPEHDQRREFARRWFVPPAVAALEPQLRALTESLVDGFVARGAADLYADFALPVPVSSFCAVVGVEIEDRDRFVHWADELTSAMAYPERGAVARRELRAFTTAEVERRRRSADAGDPVPEGLLSPPRHRALRT